MWETTESKCVYLSSSCLIQNLCWVPSKNVNIIQLRKSYYLILWVVVSNLAIAWLQLVETEMSSIGLLNNLKITTSYSPSNRGFHPFLMNLATVKSTWACIQNQNQTKKTNRLESRDLACRKPKPDRDVNTDCERK